ESKCAYVITVMAILWLTEAIPIPVTALIPIFLFPLLGVVAAADVSNSYIKDTTMLFLGGLIVAVALEESRLHIRISLCVMMIVGAQPIFLMAGLMATTWFLSMWISNTAATSMMIPIIEAVLQNMEDVRKMSKRGELRRVAKAFALSVAYGANIGGIATLTGTPPNLVLKQEADKMREIQVLTVFISLVCLWLFRAPPNITGWGNFFFFRFVSDSTPCILLSVLLFLLPAEKPKVFWLAKDDRPSYVPLIDWKSVSQKLPWGVIVLLGGGFAIADASKSSGLSRWVGNELKVFASMESWVMNIVICFIVAGATEVTSNTATATLLMPVLSELAIQTSIHPLYLMMSATVAGSFAFMLPVATPPNAIVFSSGYLTIPDMALAGLPMNIIAVLCLTLGINTWGSSMFQLDTFPETFNMNITMTNK
ncbi:Na(+)/citrate cotransporter-like, partial [Mercenaria mercenaria]|uniref:Na(+)/citrate cotransporter-like n=1 Tax=Mercenaria mercenaria TaxID=6596 RepID=UPI00234F2437